jgi:hypothetical protein
MHGAYIRLSLWILLWALGINEEHTIFNLHIFVHMNENHYTNCNQNPNGTLKS